MKELKITQWNADHMEVYGWDHFKKHTENTDVCILQRVMTDDIWNLDFEYVHSAGQGYGDDVSVVIASNIPYHNEKDIDLPSRELLKKIDDKHQGGKAISCVIEGVEFISALPCHEGVYDEFTLSRQDIWKDMKYLFENFIHTDKCLIGADFHQEAYNDPTHESMIKTNGFKSHANNLITFTKKQQWGNRGPDTTRGINLDRVLTKGDIRVFNLESFPQSVKRNGHILFNYSID